MRIIDIKLPQNAYRVLIAPSLLDNLGPITADVAPHTRAMLVMDANVADSHGRIAAQSLQQAGYELAQHQLVAQEPLKVLSTVENMYHAMLEAGLDRTSPLISLGGGLVGDVAGFAAATFLRGIPLIHVPTTLLAMVDASVGGKTAVNFPLPDASSEAASSDPGLGKNLVGAFWQPRVVLVDPHTLRTLNERDFRCGLAECVKHGVLADADLLAFLNNQATALASLDMHVLVELIERSVRIKARIVQQDEREAGKRALLNLGHTFAHVIEPIPTLDLRHGEAVAIGLCAAARCAQETNRMTSDQLAQLRDLLAVLNLPIYLPAPVDVDGLINAMGYDKKVAAGALRLILPRGLGNADIVENPDRSLIEAGWSAVAAPNHGSGGGR